MILEKLFEDYKEELTQLGYRKKGLRGLNNCGAVNDCELSMLREICRLRRQNNELDARLKKIEKQLDKKKTFDPYDLSKGNKAKQ
jgi:hypothetical protein